MKHWWYFECGGNCDGTVRVWADSRVEAKLLAEEECGCDGGCHFLGADAGADESDCTDEQKLFVPPEEFVRTLHSKR